MARSGVVILLEYFVKQPNKNPMPVSRKFVFNHLKLTVCSTQLLGFKQGKYVMTLFKDEHYWLCYNSLKFSVYMYNIKTIDVENHITREEIRLRDQPHRIYNTSTLEWISDFVKNLKTTDPYIKIQLLVNECIVRI